MEPGLVKLVTTTFYDLNKEVDRVRASIAEKTMALACEGGYEIIVVDGGSEEKTLERFREAGASVYRQERSGMGEGRRQAIRKAISRNPEVILWMEPEKSDLIRSIGKITDGFSKAGVELVLPQRTNFDSYPIFQQITEQLGNYFFRQITGINSDIYFGPSAWRTRVSNYFLDYDITNGDNQDSITVPPVEMILNGVMANFIQVDFNLDKEQREVEEKNSADMNLKRIKQLHQLSNIFAKYNGRK